MVRIDRLIYNDQMDIQTVQIINNLIDELNAVKLRLSDLEINQDPTAYQRVEVPVFGPRSNGLIGDPVPSDKRQRM